MHGWIAANVHYHGKPTEAGVDQVKDSLAAKCVADAEVEGLSLDDLEGQFGSLDAYIQGEVARIGHEEAARNVTKEY